VDVVEAVRHISQRADDVIMETMSSHRWAASDRPLVFAHRGGSRLAPENTLAAFDRAVAEGADGLELDVRLTRDGEVAVCHDARLDRTCDAQGAIADLMALELASVDAGYRFTPGDGTNPYRGRGVTVPLLRDVLARYPRVWLIVELKDDSTAMATAAVRVVREAGALDRVCFGSFSSEVLAEVRRLEPAAVTSGGRSEVFWAITTARLGFLWPFHRYKALQVPEQREDVRVVTPGLLRGARRAGVPVQVWIVDGPDDIRRLLNLGVAGVITDRPDVAVRVVGEYARNASQATGPAQAPR
jgi:glycerophosphoryl diester phosphodiesterase